MEEGEFSFLFSISAFNDSGWRGSKQRKRDTLTERKIKVEREVKMEWKLVISAINE